MIIDYFDNDDNWAPFNRIAHEWVGTPFHHMSILKHRGADCTTFIGGMLLEAQIIKKVEYDFYPPDWYAINPNLLLETVQNNLKKNLIEGLSVEVVENIKDIKRGVYKLGSFKEFIPLIKPNVKRLYNYLIKVYPSVQITIWETSWLHDFMNHQPFNSFIIIEIDKDVLEPAFYFLKEKRNLVYINPKKEDIEKYISNENVIIIKSIIQGSPNIKIKKINIPKIEKILVDIFFENSLFRTFQGQELINIFKRVFEEYTINLTTLLRYARKRGIKEKINDFIVNTVKVKSGLLE